VSAARVSTALLAVLALTLAACGGGGGTETSKQATGARNTPAVPATSNVPRYAGKPDATKQPTLASLGELKQLPLPDPNAAVPNVKGSDAPLEQFLDTVGNDAATYWQRVFNNSGFKLDGNRQSIVTDSVQGACGAVSADEPPSYCEKDSTVYLPVAFFRDKVVPIGDAAAVTMVGIIYGFRVEDVVGAFQQQRAGKLKQVDVNLQAICMAGAWEATVAKRNLFEEGDIDEVIALAKATADAPGTSQESAGTGAQRLSAFKYGFENGPSGCVKVRGE
jgi:predicted metalloprotease